MKDEIKKLKKEVDRLEALLTDVLVSYKELSSSLDFLKEWYKENVKCNLKRSKYKD